MPNTTKRRLQLCKARESKRRKLLESSNLRTTDSTTNQDQNPSGGSGHSTEHDQTLNDSRTSPSLILKKMVNLLVLMINLKVEVQ